MGSQTSLLRVHVASRLLALGIREMPPPTNHHIPLRVTDLLRRTGIIECKLSPSCRTQGTRLEQPWEMHLVKLRSPLCTISGETRFTTRVMAIGGSRIGHVEYVDLRQLYSNLPGPRELWSIYSAILPWER